LPPIIIGAIIGGVSIWIYNNPYKEELVLSDDEE